MSGRDEYQQLLVAMRASGRPRPAVGPPRWRVVARPRRRRRPIHLLSMVALGLGLLASLLGTLVVLWIGSRAVAFALSALGRLAAG